ncbi:MAG: hypothetical protein WBE72_04500 [Terracidiphilus sp.]
MGAQTAPFYFLFPVAIITVVFAFTAVVHFVNSRRQEREAFYRAETLRRITEASGEGAKAAVELMREDQRIKAAKVCEGVKLAGLINVGVGIGLMIFLHALLGGGGGSILHGGTGSVYLCGLIPGLIGVAMLVYVYLLAPRPESGPKC